MKAKFNITDQEFISSAGAISTSIYSSILTDTSPGTYTLANPPNDYANNGLVKKIRNDSLVTHNISITDLSQTNDVGVPTLQYITLMWIYTDDSNYAGIWYCIEYSSLVSFGND